MGPTERSPKPGQPGTTVATRTTDVQTPDKAPTTAAPIGATIDKARPTNRTNAMAIEVRRTTDVTAAVIAGGDPTTPMDAHPAREYPLVGETSALCAKLGHNQSRSVVTGGSPRRIRDRVHIATTTLQPQQRNPSTHGSRAALGPGGGNLNTSPKEGYPSSRCGQHKPSFPLQMLPSSLAIAHMEHIGVSTVAEVITMEPSQTLAGVTDRKGITERIGRGNRRVTARQFPSRPVASVRCR